MKEFLKTSTTDNSKSGQLEKLESFHRDLEGQIGEIQDEQQRGLAEDIDERFEGFMDSVCTAMEVFMDKVGEEMEKLEGQV
jgi:hypothetical protein